MDTVGPIISTISDLLANTLVGAFEGASFGIGVAIDGITLIIQGISDTVQSVVDFVTAIANGDWAAAWDALKNVAKGALEMITGALETVIGTLTGLVGAIGGTVDKVGSFVTGKGSSGGDLPHNAAGTPNWSGGWTHVNEKGGEIMNLPNGTQIIPHDASRNTPVGGGISIAKLADTIVVREDADIDRIAEAIARS